MDENASLADKLNGVFNSKVTEELEALKKGFGTGSPNLISMALKNALGYMEKTYPDMFFEAKIVSLWKAMSFVEKVCWYFHNKIFSAGFRWSLAAEYIRIHRAAPPWLVPAPKEEEIVWFHVGIGRKH